MTAKDGDGCARRRSRDGGDDGRLNPCVSEQLNRRPAGGVLGDDLRLDQDKVPAL